MTHWGWYWKVKKKHIPKRTCSTMPLIDSFKLYKGNQRAGFTVQPLGIKAIPSEGSLALTYGKRKRGSYVIPIDRLSCTYGGFRYFFRCPLCQKRMRFLYLAENSVFLCRGCLNLCYLSQRLRPADRYHHMGKKIKDEIASKGGDLSAGEKPPRMHRGNYQRLVDKYFYYEEMSRGALVSELRLWHGILIEAC